jgi:phage shock protein PspC (stress-responsive transcriptional regulator)
MDSTTTGDTPPLPPPPPPQPPPAPPRAGSFSERLGVTRPKQGRVFFGVCAGLARATNTDPLLFRVIVGVLVLFHGIGVLFYLLGILLLTEEGDEASPLESLFGRGRATLNAAWTVVVMALCVVLTLVMFDGGPSVILLAVAGAIGIALLLRRPAGVPVAPAPPVPGAPQPAAPQPAAPQPAAQPSPTAMTAQIPVVNQGEQQMVTPTYTPPPSYAPHGPFEPPPPPPPVPPRPPKPPKEPSMLGRVVFFIALIALGAVAVLVATTSLDWTAYLAVPLGIIGVGLLVGSRTNCRQPGGSTRPAGRRPRPRRSTRHTRAATPTRRSTCGRSTSPTRTWPPASTSRPATYAYCCRRRSMSTWTRGSAPVRRSCSTSRTTGSTSTRSSRTPARTGRVAARSSCG